MGGKSIKKLALMGKFDWDLTMNHRGFWVGTIKRDGDVTWDDDG